MEIEENLNDKEPKIYEVGYLLSPLVAEDKVADTITDTVRKAIAEAEGVVLSEVAPAMRALAYPVAKVVGSKRSSFQDAYFGAIKFQVKPKTISAINHALETSDTIIRFLVTIVPKEAPAKPPRRLPKTPSTDPDQSEAPVGDAVKSPMTAEDIDKEIEGLLVKA